MTTAPGRLAPILAVAALLVSCGDVTAPATSSGGSAPSQTATASAPATGTTAAALRTAHWGSNVSLSFSGTSVTISSNGIPDHARPAEYAVPSGGGATGGVPTAATATAQADPTQAQQIHLTITTSPAAAATATAAHGGLIGIMVSGAVLFDPYEGDGHTVAVAANFTVTDSQGNRVAFIDSCNGHPGPGGIYHYHGLPTCITSTVDGASGPSHLIGVALDGYPIYGDRDIHGAQITEAQLDACNGISSATPEFPQGIYHYVLLDTKDAHSSIGCFHGSATQTGGGGQGPPGGGPPGGGMPAPGGMPGARP